LSKKKRKEKKQLEKQVPTETKTTEEIPSPPPPVNILEKQSPVTPPEDAPIPSAQETIQPDKVVQEPKPQKEEIKLVVILPTKEPEPQVKSNPKPNLAVVSDDDVTEIEEEPPLELEEQEAVSQSSWMHRIFSHFTGERRK
jgi:hypothetical protein